MEKLSPMNGNLLLKAVENDQQTYGNIVLPDIGKEKPELAEVVEVSDTYNWHANQAVKSNFSVGEKVLIPKVGAIKVTFDGEDYLICKETEILAKIK